ncbi:cupin domain-containing protein [Nocardia sp. NPDC050378]|uniref:cupin domain-containing protein n=1 Tax=Nocardia sp. NPDC050378 TaxID=3155400 RepID=UPI0034071E0A
MDTRDIALCLPEDAETLGTDRVRVRLLTDSEASDGTVSTVEVTLDQGADGAAPHYHTRSDELFYVADGELQVMAGERILTVGAGGSLVVPRRMPHAFGATPDSGARILIALMPGVQRFEYFRLLDRLAKGAAEHAEFLAAQAEFDNYFIDAPAWTAERNAQRR